MLLFYLFTLLTLSVASHFSSDLHFFTWLPLYVQIGTGANRQNHCLTNLLCASNLDFIPSWQKVPSSDLKLIKLSVHNYISTIIINSSIIVITISTIGTITYSGLAQSCCPGWGLPDKEKHTPIHLYIYITLHLTLFIGLYANIQTNDNTSMQLIFFKVVVVVVYCLKY